MARELKSLVGCRSNVDATVCRTTFAPGQSDEQAFEQSSRLSPAVARFGIEGGMKDDKP